MLSAPTQDTLVMKIVPNTVDSVRGFGGEKCDLELASEWKAENVPAVFWRTGFKGLGRGCQVFVIVFQVQVLACKQFRQEMY